jgi:hypothetical protein
MEWRSPLDGIIRERRGLLQVFGTPCAASARAWGKAVTQEDHHDEGGCLMQIARVYTGADGESHFEDVTPEQFAQIVNNVGEGPILQGEVF